MLCVTQTKNKITFIYIKNVFEALRLAKSIMRAEKSTVRPL
jgi:hypothetical protein